MSNQVTKAQLESVIARINTITDSPQQSYVGNAPQAGNYHLAGAYGGYALHRMSCTPGCSGIESIFSYHSKRELINLMFAYIEGINHGK